MLLKKWGREAPDVIYRDRPQQSTAGRGSRYSCWCRQSVALSVTFQLPEFAASSLGTIALPVSKLNVVITILMACVAAMPRTTPK